MVKELNLRSQEYKDWLTALTIRVRQVQVKASVAVNRELLMFYWELGADIVEKQRNAAWGDGLLKQLSKDLRSEFPNMKGFSKRNLEQIRRWYRFWSKESPIAKQAASQIRKVPWWHNVIIVSKCKSLDEAIYYIERTITNGWSRSVLTHQIESGLWHRKAKAISNFSEALPSPQSDMAKEITKDPYCFDFLTLSEEYNELELERGLTEHITHFLLELGAGFAYVGRQVALEVGGRDFFIDLLFYHTRLHCYIVVELKTVEFEPEHAGKLNFYLKAVDAQFREEADGPTIGMLLCKNRNKTIVEYSLSDISKPIGVSEYQIIKSLPDKLKSSLPSIKELEAELGKDLNQE